MKFRRAFRDEPDVNLIPLIDVLLIVVIFLAVNTTYSRFSELQIDLPSADATHAKTRPSEIQVAVTADGRYAIAQSVVMQTEPATLALLLRRAAEGQVDPVVVINADAQATHQAVVTMLEAARLAGLAHISFATQRQSTP